MEEVSAFDPVNQALQSEDVLQHLFQYLDYEDLATAGRVCWAWQQHAQTARTNSMPNEAFYGLLPRRLNLA